MDDHQGRPSAVNLGPFVGVDLNLCTDRLHRRYRNDADVKHIQQNQTKFNKSSALTLNYAIEAPTIESQGGKGLHSLKRHVITF